MTKAREIAELGAVYDSGALSNRNLITNGDFQVWQRGTSFSSLSSKTYVADRWYTFDGSVSKGTQVMPEGYTTNSLDWTNDNTSDSDHFWQGVEDGQPRLKDRPCTLSVVLSCTSGTMSISPAFNGSTISGTTWNVTTTPTRFTYTRSASDNSGLNGTVLYVGLDNLLGNNGTLKMSQFQLEVGDTATPFEHRSYGDELALCQRYYFRRTGSGRHFIGGNGSVSLCYPTTFFPVAMRVSPSFSYSALSDFYIEGLTGGGQAVCTSLAFNASATTSFTIQARSGGSTTGTAGQVMGTGGGANSWTAFDAEF